MKGQWVEPDVRDRVVDDLARWRTRTGLSQHRLCAWAGMDERQLRRWQSRYGMVNEHNAPVPRDHWLEAWEQRAIQDFAREYPLEGYRRLTYMLLDRGVVAVSPASVYRVLREAGVMGTRWLLPNRKGTGFVQPRAPHEHWHVDFSYLNIGGTFYYLCSVLDGASRYLVHWEIRESMKEADAEIVLQRAREKFPRARPRIITDRGSQFIARDFKQYLRHWQATHVFTSPHYPQSNGKLERFHRTLKQNAIRPKNPAHPQGRPPHRRDLHHPLQRDPPPQRHRLPHPQGPPPGPPKNHPQRTRIQTCQRPRNP